MNGSHLPRFWLFFVLAVVTVLLVGSGYSGKEEKVSEAAQAVQVLLSDLPPAENAKWQSLSAADSLYFLENCLELTE